MAERALIPWNVPNMVTIPLMAFVGFLVFAVAWQLVSRLRGGGGQSNQGAY